MPAAVDTIEAEVRDVVRRRPAVNVRKFVARASGVDDLVRLGMLPVPPARFLAAAVIQTVPLYGLSCDRLARAGGHPPWAERFARHGLDLAALLAEG